MRWLSAKTSDHATIRLCIGVHDDSVTIGGTTTKLAEIRNRRNSYLILAPVDPALLNVATSGGCSRYPQPL